MKFLNQFNKSKYFTSWKVTNIDLFDKIRHFVDVPVIFSPTFKMVKLSLNKIKYLHDNNVFVNFCLALYDQRTKYYRIRWLKCSQNTKQWKSSAVLESGNWVLWACTLKETIKCKYNVMLSGCVRLSFNEFVLYKLMQRKILKW